MFMCMLLVMTVEGGKMKAKKPSPSQRMIWGQLQNILIMHNDIGI